MPESAPAHWQALKGPANWFRLQHPPGWRSEERDGTFALYPPDTSALITINTIWTESPSVPLPDLRQIAAQFPFVRNVRPIQESRIRHAVDSLQGEAILEVEPNRWKRLFKPGQWRSWTMWQLERPSLLTLVTLMHAGPRDPELEAMTRMILRYMDLPVQVAVPPEVFAERVISFARRELPSLNVELQEDFRIQLSNVQLALHSCYRAYLDAPGDFEQIVGSVLQTAMQVHERSLNQTDQTLKAVRDRVMPMLFLERSWRENMPEVCGESWIAGLATLYVVKEENAYSFICQSRCADWGISQEDLHKIAIENLEKFLEEHPVEFGVVPEESGHVNLLTAKGGDRFVAVRLLSDTFLTRLREVVAGNVVVGIPGRDSLIGVSLRMTEMIRQVRRQVGLHYQQTDHPLTDRMLLVSADGVSELVDDDVR